MGYSAPVGRAGGDSGRVDADGKRGPMLIGRLPHKGDLLGGLTAAAVEGGVKAGIIQVIGSLERARLSFYDQWARRYREFSLDTPLEIAAGLGNISLKDDTPFVHLHLSLADREGAMTGGHAVAGCTVFAAEYAIIPLAGPPLVRVHDETTGLFLWERERYGSGPASELPADIQRALFIP